MAKTLRVYRQDEHGLNIEFIDIATRERFTLEDLIFIISLGGRYSQDYQIRQKSDGKYFIVSKPDGNPVNNIE